MMDILFWMIIVILSPFALVMGFYTFMMICIPIVVTIEHLYLKFKRKGRK